MKPDSPIQWEPGSNRAFSTNSEYKFIVHMEDIWGMIKIIFKFAMEDKVFAMYMAGEVGVTGYPESNPALMHLRLARSTKNKRIAQVWERELIVPSESEKLIYRYGIRERENSSIRWERDVFRVFYLKDLKYYEDENFDNHFDIEGFKDSAPQSFTYKNSGYFRLDQDFKKDFIYCELSDLLWLGPFPETLEISKLKNKGCKVLLCLLDFTELVQNKFNNEQYEIFCTKNQLEYQHVPICLPPKMDSELLMKAATQLFSNINKNKCTYLFCGDGLVRSVLVAFLFYHIYLNYPRKSSIEMILSKRWNSPIDEDLINWLMKNIKINEKT